MDETVASIDVRSYRSVFELERRVYRIDRLRLNPAGVPVRSFVYFAVLALAVLLIQGVPVVGAAVRELPWYLREGGLAALAAALLTVVKVDGRASHLAALSIWRMLATPRRLWRMSSASRSRARWAPPELLLLPDGSQAGAARLRYGGPGAVLVLAHHRCRLRSRGRRLLLSATATGSGSPRPRVLAVGRRTTVEVAGREDVRR
jgi:hypothetical protein